MSNLVPLGGEGHGTEARAREDQSTPEPKLILGIFLTLRTYLHVFDLIIHLGGEAMTKEYAVEDSVNITSEKNIKLKQKQKIPTSSCTPMS